MRWLLVALMVMIAFPAVAADNTGKPYFIINGRKFFPLSDARTYSGNKKPMPARFPPKQGAISHNLPINRTGHGKGDTDKSPLMTLDKNKEQNNTVKMIGNEPPAVNPAAANSPVQGAVITPVSPSGAKGGNNKASKDMLSIFEPEGK